MKALTGRHIEPHGLAQEGRRLLAGEAEVFRAQLAEQAAGAQAR
jgi:hypothetical protein